MHQRRQESRSGAHENCCDTHSSNSVFLYFSVLGGKVENLQGNLQQPDYTTLLLYHKIVDGERTPNETISNHVQYDTTAGRTVIPARELEIQWQLSGESRGNRR